MILEKIVVTVYDRVSGQDNSPRFSHTEAHAIREFKQAVNMPSEMMLYHVPADFELVKVGEIYRNDDQQLITMRCERETLITGMAAIDDELRKRYAQLAMMVNNTEVSQHAPQ